MRAAQPDRSCGTKPVRKGDVEKRGFCRIEIVDLLLREHEGTGRHVATFGISGSRDPDSNRKLNKELAKLATISVAYL
jgi:hypothetical protein